jgi:adenylate cyclase
MTASRLAGIRTGLRRTTLKYGARWLIGILLTVLACAQAKEFLPTTLIDKIDLFIYDTRMRVMPAEPDTRIVIVDIDEKSIAEIGRWPWNRDVMAQLVDKLTGKYEAAAVGFDIVFSEADTTSGFNLLESLSKRELKDLPKFGERIRQLKPELDFDGHFAKTMQARPVVLGYALSNERNAFSKGLLPDPAFTKQDLHGYALDAYSYKAYIGNLPELQRAAAGGGYFSPILDSDGVIRRVTLLSQVGDGYYESLSLATARVALGVGAVEPVFPESLLSEQDAREYGALEALILRSKPQRTVIPIERDLTALIKYRGSGGPGAGIFRYVSATDVINGRLPEQAFAQRIFLVGTTVAGLKDLRVAPVSNNYPGVEMHANVIASILDADFIQKPDFSIGIDMLQILLIGALLIFALPVMRPAYSILLTFVVVSAAAALNFWAYWSWGYVLPIATVLLLVMALFIVNIALGYLFEYRKINAMTSLFGEYVAPELVAQMAENPESYNMEGESRELTVLFVDVRGFTTISESLKPNELREFINLYLTAMSEDIRGNRGTLDKYIGDAVMAFWGAPVALPNHAELAVATALKMLVTAKRLDQEFQARNWPPLKIGIGLNTGEMRVGDMGSKIRRAYTVMGDAVNLGSRLEGITKEYGVGLVVGDVTRNAAPQFAYRELDRVRVKGKHEPVPIFHPIALDAELDPVLRAAFAKWHEALAFVRTQQWDAAENILRQLLEEYPDDGLYKLYVKRIAHYRENPPGPDWDGVTTFQTK